MKYLEYRIEELLEVENSSFKISKEIEKFIKQYDAKKVFLESSGKGKQFSFKHTKFYDSIISLIYKTVLRTMFGNYLPMRNSIPIIVVALGSYGREELSIHSDIDLMLAFKDIEGYSTKQIIEKFIYMAWDSGLKLGHRVHSISEIEEVAKSDQTIKTALIESRKIIGSAFVWSSLQYKLDRVRETEISTFIFDKCDEAKIRYSKYQRGSMETDLKDGVGGLRDSNMLFWILNSVYKVDNIRELAGILFSEDEFRKYSLALDFLYQVRTALHLSTKRKRDKIVLEDIPILTETLSINSHTQFSHKLISSLSIIHGFALKNIRKAIKPHQFQIQNISKFRKNRIQKDVFLVDGTLSISSNLKFQNTQEFLIFLQSLPDVDFQLNQTIYSLIENIEFDNNFDRNVLISLFERKYLYPIIDILYKTASIEKILPPFEKVMFLPQFDGYHKHPVDIHSIYNIKELEKIQDPFLLGLYNSLPTSEVFILKVASLFHDIGKGRIEEHSKVGARVIRSFLKQFDLANEVIERVATLIRYHTLMSSLAYHEDIYDEKIIFSFTSKLRNLDNLKLLYLLTYADIKSVNSSSFSSYSKNLLNTLYKNSLPSFGNSEMLKESEKRAKKENQIQNSENFKTLPRTLQKRILNIKSNLAFFKLTTNSIIELSKKAREIERFSFEVENQNFLSIKIIRAGNVNFDIAYFLNRVNFLSVISLDIFELFDGIKYFQIDFSEKVSEDDQYFIDSIIENSFLEHRKKFQKINPIIKRDEVKIDCEYSNSYLKLSIHTLNQNGLLAYLFKLFEDEQIDVVSAKTQTFKKRVKDTFLFNRKSPDCDKYYKLIELIC